MFKTCLKLSPLSTVFEIHFENLEKNLLQSDVTSLGRARAMTAKPQIHFSGIVTIFSRSFATNVIL